MATDADRILLGKSDWQEGGNIQGLASGVSPTVYQSDQNTL